MKLITFISPLFSWNNYYKIDFDSDEKYEGSSFSSTSIALNITSGNAYIYQCHFYDMHSSLDAGAIYFSDSKSNILVEKCTLSNCTAERYGGGIRVAYGNSIIALTCGHHCSTENKDGFCGVDSHVTRSINSIIDSSISSCEALYSAILNQGYGYINIKEVNISHNKARDRTAIACTPTKNNKDNDIGCEISFCSFENNTAEQQYCIYLTNFRNTKCKHQIRNTNVINNGGQNIIFSMGTTDIIQSSFLENDDPCFSQNITDSIIILKNCTIDSLTGSFAQYETTNTFIIALSFIETDKCHNLFIHFLPASKCHTLQSNHLFHSKIIFNFIFIFAFSH